MSEDQGLSQKRKRSRFPILVAVLALALLISFLTAPIIPVDGKYTVSGYLCGSYTDWQSPSYHLFNIGYHLVVNHAYCL